jgi:hypothetical protein
VSLYLIPFGAIFLGVGGWLYFDQRDFEAKAERTTGTVIDVKRETSTSTSRNRASRSTVYRPVIQFEVKGQSYTFTSSSSSSSYNYPRGKRLDVLYDPANPSDARMADSVVSLIAIIMLGVGALLMLVGLFLPFLIKGGAR